MSGSMAQAADSIFDRSVSVKQAGLILRQFQPEQQALILASAFDAKLNELGATGFHDGAESHGRRIEKVIVELDDEGVERLVRELIESGDTEMVWQIVRGHAGDYSGVAEHLTADLIREMFALDHDPSLQRLMLMCQTLICETRPDNEAVNEFFISEEGQNILTILKSNEDGDENIPVILRTAYLDRGIEVSEEKLADAEHVANLPDEPEDEDDDRSRLSDDDRRFAQDIDDELDDVEDDDDFDDDDLDGDSDEDGGDSDGD